MASGAGSGTVGARWVCIDRIAMHDAPASGLHRYSPASGGVEPVGMDGEALRLAVAVDGAGSAVAAQHLGAEGTVDLAFGDVACAPLGEAAGLGPGVLVEGEPTASA